MLDMLREAYMYRITKLGVNGSFVLQLVQLKVLVVGVYECMRLAGKESGMFWS